MRRGYLAALSVALLFAMVTAPLAQTSPLVRPGEVLRGYFAQERVLSGFDAPLRSTGRFVLAPERGLIWRTMDPIEMVTVITPSGLLQKNDDVVLTRVAAARTPLFRRLYDMLGKALLGDWQPFEALYHVRRSEDGERWRVKLTPREKSGEAAFFSEVAVAGARFAETVEMWRPGGTFDHLRFLNQTVSTGPLSTEEANLLDSVDK